MIDMDSPVPARPLATQLRACRIGIEYIPGLSATSDLRTPAAFCHPTNLGAGDPAGREGSILLF